MAGCWRFDVKPSALASDWFRVRCDPAAVHRLGNMTEETLSETLARRHAALRLDQVPGAVIQAAKLHILDSLGCLLAGSRLEAGRLAHDLVRRISGGAGSPDAATLVGTGTRVSYLDAVQAMSVAAHCGEMDDIHSGAGTCIGGMVVPALMAMAEIRGGTGGRFIEAAIVGYETTTRIGLTIDAARLFVRGWWPSTLCGVFGVAAAGAKFFAWPVDMTVNALGIASLHAGGMLTGGAEGASARHLLFGRAAQSGVLSLLAAEHGFTGPKRAFEDPRGFCLTLCSQPRWEYLRSVERYFLPEVAFKPYPCARQLHAGVEALLHLLERHTITPETVEEIELAVPTAVAGIVNRPGNSIGRAAVLGSGQYVTAVTLLRGKMDLHSFTDEMLSDPRVQDLMSKVRVTGAPDLDRYFPQSWPGKMSVKLSTGESWTHTVVIPKGESENPLPEAEVEAKFLSLAAPSLGDLKARSILAQVLSLEQCASLAPLLDSLSVSA
jgi:2-methylcitrate dehydratase PrpD